MFNNYCSFNLIVTFLMRKGKLTLSQPLTVWDYSYLIWRRLDLLFRFHCFLVRQEIFSLLFLADILKRDPVVSPKRLGECTKHTLRDASLRGISSMKMHSTLRLLSQNASFQEWSSMNCLSQSMQRSASIQPNTGQHLSTLCQQIGQYFDNKLANISSEEACTRRRFKLVSVESQDGRRRAEQCRRAVRMFIMKRLVLHRLWAAPERGKHSSVVNRPRILVQGIFGHF